MKTIIKAFLLTFTLFLPFTMAHADDDNAPMSSGYGMSMMGGGYGPGMMNGQGMGYGNGYHMRNGYRPGMMGGYGMGMMGGYGMGIINLSNDQIKKMQKIRTKAMNEMTPMMNKMWKTRNEMFKAMRSRDNKAISKAYDDMAAAKKAMFLERMKVQEKIQNVLTKEQKEKLRNAYRGMMMGY